MLSAALALLFDNAYFLLHFAVGSFPRPLKAEEEAEYPARFAAGDMEARNTLIERNLRLL